MSKQGIGIAVFKDGDTSNRVVTETNPLPTGIMILDHETGLPSPVVGHHGMLHSMDYLTGIGLGIVPNHEIFRGFGQRTSLSTVATGDDISENTLAALSVPDQTVGEQMTVVSTAGDDTLAGANVQKIGIDYLDADGNAQTETVEMEGTTPVDTAATNIRFIQKIHTIQIGSFGETAAGDISIYRKGTASRVYTVIKTGGNISLNSSRMIPAGKEFALDYISVSGTSNKPLSVRLRATCTDEAELTPGIFLFNELFSVQDSGFALPIRAVRRFPSLTIVKGTAYSSQAGGDVSLSWGGWIE